MKSETSGAPGGALPLLGGHPWPEAFPDVVAGITTAGPDGDFDLALFGVGGTREVTARWDLLRRESGVPAAVHVRQVHGSAVLVHRELPPGLHLAATGGDGASSGGIGDLPGADGHLTRSRGLLLTVAVADCVPVYLLAPEAGAIGLLHAGWRGAAAGIVEAGIAGLHDRFGIEPAEVRVHLGPSICGECYEVGPEVHEALGEPVPDGPTPIDLPAVLAAKAVAAGVRRSAVTRSEVCTKCGKAGLFSHRGGDAGRQIAFLALRGGRPGDGA